MRGWLQVTGAAGELGLQLNHALAQRGILGTRGAVVSGLNTREFGKSPSAL